MFTNNIEEAKRSIRTAMDFSYETCLRLIKQAPDKKARWIYGCRSQLGAHADMVLWLLEDPNNSELYDYAIEYRDNLIDQLTAR